MDEFLRHALWMGKVGMVSLVNKDQKWWKCYIGTFSGMDEEADMIHIIGTGDKVPQHIAEAAFPIHANDPELKWMN